VRAVPREYRPIAVTALRGGCVLHSENATGALRGGDTTRLFPNSFRLGRRNSSGPSVVLGVKRRHDAAHVHVCRRPD